MRDLLCRAQHLYRNQGAVTTIQTAIRFLIRYLRHRLGTKYLYASPYFREILVWSNSRVKSTVPDPFMIIRVDPSEISHVTDRGPNPGQFQWQDIGTVQGGNWDQNDQHFETLPVVQTLRDRFEDETNWEDIEFIQHVLEQVEHGRVIWRGCTDKEDVRDACNRVDKLYESIREDGYQSKRELADEGVVPPDKYVDGDRFNCHDEVVVDIGRDGQFLFVDGRHRLTIAKILDIDEIPVRVSARHADWQRKRESYANKIDLKSIPKRYRTHPDLQDVLPDKND